MARWPTPRSTTRRAPRPCSASGTTSPRTPRTTAACTAVAGYLSQLSTDLFENSRATVAEFLGCREGDQVVFTRSTTDSLNLLAAVVPADCEVFVFETEHHASLLPWRDAAVTYLDAPRTPQQAVATLERALAARTAVSPGGQGPALVCVTGASNVTGELWPVRELAAAAHAHGARIVLDAAQLAPHHPVDIAELDVDWVAFSGHKLYAPFGSGVLMRPLRLASGRRAVPRRWRCLAQGRPAR